jgi:hypothetical protein
MFSCTFFYKILKIVMREQKMAEFLGHGELGHLLDDVLAMEYPPMLKPILVNASFVHLWQFLTSGHIA